MLAAVFAQVGRLELREVPEPHLQGEDDVLLEVEAAAVCGTDLHILHDPPGHPGTVGVVLGHEYVGRVVEVGPAVASVAVGDRVAVAPNLNCLLCSFCRAGLTNLCERVTTLGIFRDGGFARYSVVPARAAFRVAPEVPPDDAVWAEALSGVVGGVRRLAPQPGESAVVLGAGPIGLLYIQVLRAAGVRPIVAVEPRALRRQLALRSGAARAVDPGAEEVAAAVREALPRGPDLVLDCVGSVADVAIALARPGGRVLLFGQNSQARATIAQNEVTRRELTVLGSYASRHTFPAAVTLLEQRLLDLEPLVTHRLPLRELPAGLAAIAAGEAGKVVVYPG